MARLIDSEALKQSINRALDIPGFGDRPGYAEALKSVLKWIDNAPTDKAAILCEDCACFEAAEIEGWDGICKYTDSYTDKTAFCSYGQPKKKGDKYHEKQGKA